MKRHSTGLRNKTSAGIAGAFIIGFSIFQLVNLGDSLAYRFGVKDNSRDEAVESSDNKYLACSGKRLDTSEFDQNLTPESIKIEKSGINLNVVSMPLVNGTWEVKKGFANYAEGTSLINGIDGNVGIYAHDTDAEFTNIKTLQTGDIISVYAGGYKIKYEVKSVQNTGPEDVDVFYPTDKPILTLVTCDGILSQLRFVLKAELVEIEQLSC